MNLLKPITSFGLFLSSSLLLAQNPSNPLVVLPITSPVTQGDYKAQQEVRVKPGGQVSTTSSSQNAHLFIDPYISVSATYNPSGNFGPPPVNYALDLNKPVGKIPHSFNISPLGSADCNIPIDLPPGINGFDPDLSLNYSSFSSWGELGMGWSIGGLQSIARVSQNLFNNNNVRSVDLTNSDVFTFNGNRLIPISGSNGQPGTVYDNETKIFNKTTSNGTYGNGPDWFKVETKQGLTLEFGNSIDSKYVPIGQTTVWEWKLNKVYDQNGNSIIYEYANSGGECLIKEIKYTQNLAAGISPFNSIKFFFNQADEGNSFFVNGGEVKQKSLLRKIEVKSEGVLASSYNFAYTQYFDNSYLTEIVKSGSDFSQLNPLKFSYHNDSGSPTLSQTNGLANNSFKHFEFIDFTGDGVKDAIALEGGLNTSNSAFLWTNWRALKHDGNSGFTQINNYNFAPNAVDFIDFFPLSKNVMGDITYSSFDFNGDNKEDMLFRKVSGSVEIMSIYLSNGITGFNSSPNIVLNVPISSSGNPHQFWFLDLNGDQKLDLFYAENTTLNTNNFTIKVYMDILSNPSAPDASSNETAYIFKNARPFDVDGDGKMELLVQEFNSANSTLFKKVYVNNLNQIVFDPLVYSGAFAHNEPNYFLNTTSNIYGMWDGIIKLDGDFNGDGKSDYIFSSQLMSSPTYSFGLFLNRGDQTYSQPIVLNKSALDLKDHNLGAIKYFYYTSDMNHDGKTDMVEISSTNQLRIFFSRGVNGDYFFREDYGFIGPIDLNNIEFVDMDGNGVNDIVNYSTNPAAPAAVPFIIYLYKGEKSRNIYEIVDAYGKIEVDVKPLTNSTVYNLSQSLVYPLTIISNPIYIVNQVKTPNGIGGQNITNYSYENAVLHKRGKGLLCFKKVTKTNLTMDSKQIEEYTFDPSSFNLFHFKTSYFNLSTNTLIDDEVINNQNLLVSNGCFWPTINNQLRTNYLQNYTVFKEFGYDADGNTTLSRTKINTNLDVEETFYSNFVSNGSWLPTRPTIVTNNFNRAGKAQYSQITNFSYDSQGKVLVETKNPSDTKEISVSHLYHPLTGVSISKTTSAPNSSLPIKTESFQYDSKFRFVTSKVNPLGQVATSKYNFIFGVPIETKDVEGLTTFYVYDGFGRPTSVKTPDNLSTNYSYNWVTPGDFPGGDPLSVANCLYRTTVFKPGTPKKTGFFDLLDRQVRTEIDGFNLKNYQMNSYDSKGNISIETGPYQLTTNNPFTPILITHSYDNLNRKTQISVSDGNFNKNTTFVYSYTGGDEIISTTHPDGKGTTVVKDATGLTKMAIDNGGIINYSYYSHRNIEEVKVNGVQANYIEYDILSQKKKLVDKDAGITLYDVNAYGQLASETDANNKTYNYVYDVLDRVMNKTGPDGSYLYQYINSGSGLNKLEKQTAPNGFYTKYTYDNLSRVSQVEEYISGNSYYTKYGYNNLNKLETTKYPSNFETKTNYDINGYPKSIYNNSVNQVIWECLEVDPFGEVSKYISGNGIQTQMVRNNFGFPILINTPNVQSLNNNFNINNGNLNSRTDVLLGKTETFTYDNVDRLTKVQIMNLPDINSTYNNQGNLLSRTDIGSLSYKSNKPDAINDVSNPNSIISSNQQDVTYTPFNKISNITEDVYQYDVYYGANDQRRRSDLSSNSGSKTRIYIGDYEKTTEGANILEVHYVNTPSGLAAVHVINNNVQNTYFTYQDHLGSILKATDISGNTIVNLNYDAWGRRRNNATWDYSNATAPPAWLYRGYTEHEHLAEFDLIDMNGRIYDPILGQMLSPDIYNQNPLFSQNYNRFSYAYNNPIKYKDPSGNMIFGTVFGFIRGVGQALVRGGLDFGNRERRRTAWTKADPTLKGTAGNNGYRIDRGMWKTDPNKTAGGRYLELLSRYTWEFPQTLVGYIGATFIRIPFGQITDVTYYGGATVVNRADDDAKIRWGATLGNIINTQNVVADPYSDEMFRHEFGHTIESKQSGLIYLFMYAIPSGMSAAYHTEEEHDRYYTETRANKLALKYFERRDPKSLDDSKGGTTWDFIKYPIKK